MTNIDLAEVTPTTGILWAYAFASDGTATEIPRNRVDSVLSEPREGWIWVHLALADVRCRHWIDEHAPLSEIARETLRGPNGHMRLDIYNNEVIGVLPDLQREFAHTGEGLVRLRFVMTERMLVTARQRPVHSIEVNRRAVMNGKRFANPVSFIDAVIDQFADAVASMADQLGAELDRAEDGVLYEEPADERQRIGRVRLQAVRVHRQLAQMRSLFHRVEARLTQDNPAVGRSVRRLGQKLDAIDSEVGSLHERARLLLDELDAKMTAITNRRLFTLSILTACLLPPTLATGFFGMNTKDMPFQTVDDGTWYAFAIAFASGLGSYWILRRMKAF